MKVWAITAREYGGAEEIVVERRGEKFVHLLYADTAEGYNAALAMLWVVVADRIGKTHAMKEYDGQLGPDARLRIIVRDSRLMCDDELCLDPYSGDTIELRPYDIIGG